MRLPLKSALLTLVVCSAAFADPINFVSGDLVVSTVSYVQPSSIPTSTEMYPYIFNDSNISGIQGQVSLNQYGRAANSPLVSSTAINGMSTSFSSKSEGALMLSANGYYLTYMGYQANPGALNVSNSYTPGANIAGNTNPTYNRAVALISSQGVSVTPETNAFSGDNPRAAISVNGGQFYMVGNSDSTQPAGSTIGARYGTPGSNTSIQLGSYQSPYDHSVKDNNWRGVQIFNGNLYVSKGSGSNGINAIFQVGNGLPTSGGQTITELPGFPTTAASSTNYFPFGFWFANSSTLYVADEGNGTTSADSLAGLQKWTLGGNGQWSLDYVLQNGLALDVAKSIAGFPVQTYTVGLRNMTGVVNADGTVTLYAITSQYSSLSGGEADPTELVAISDVLSDTSLPANESFNVLQDSGAGKVFRGVALAPAAIPEPSTLGLLFGGCMLAGAWRLRRR